MSHQRTKKINLNAESPNYMICKHLIELANYEQNSNSNRFKYNAYRRAANILNQYQIEIKSGEQAKNLKGITNAVAIEIDKFLETNKMPKATELKKTESSSSTSSSEARTRLAKRKSQEIQSEETASSFKESPAKKTKTDDKPNKELVAMLLELSEYEKNVTRQIHKSKAYKKAAGSVANHPTKITTVQEAKKLGGVGKKIAEKIEQYLKSGMINKVDKIRHSDEANIIKELTRVTGIGPAAATNLVKQGIKSLDDLRKNEALLNHHQKVGLKHVDDFELRIPRDEMIKMQELIFKEIENVDKRFDKAICGSFRRGATSSGDIDILLTHPEYVSSDNKGKKAKDCHVILLKSVVERLEKIKFITDTLAFGDFKYMGVCRVDNTKPFRRIDIRLFPRDEYYCALLYFTGSDVFNQNMRKIAIEKGFTLNEYNIRRVGSSGIPGEPLPVSSEKDVFDYLEMDYKEPEERNM